MSNDLSADPTVIRALEEKVLAVWKEAPVENADQWSYIAVPGSEEDPKGLTMATKLGQFLVPNAEESASGEESASESDADADAANEVDTEATETTTSNDTQTVSAAPRRRPSLNPVDELGSDPSLSDEQRQWLKAFAAVPTSLRSMDFTPQPSSTASADFEPDQVADGLEPIQDFIDEAIRKGEHSEEFQALQAMLDDVDSDEEAESYDPDEVLSASEDEASDEEDYEQDSSDEDSDSDSDSEDSSDSDFDSDLEHEEALEEMERQHRQNQRDRLNVIDSSQPKA
jgi:hypothetical protein